MFAVIEDGKITQMPKGNKGITIGDNQYPASFFTAVYSETERNAVGVYTIEVDETNLKDPEYYNNTTITYAYDSSSDKVKGTYGTATAKPIADTLWTEQDKTDGKIRNGEDVGDVAVEGLKTIKKREIDEQCSGLLAPSDWMATKAFEEGGDVESGWKTWRASVRTKCNAMQTQIDNAADVDALKALYARNDSGVRPLGDFPVKE